MLKLLKISLLLLALYFAGGLLFGFRRIEPFIGDFLRYIIVKILEFTHFVLKFVNTNNLDLSGILTLLLLFLLCCYIVYLIFEFLRKMFCRISGRSHSPLEARTKIRKTLFSVLLVKLFLFFIQLLLLVTQAWGMSKFFELFIDKPSGLLDLIKSDAIFFAVLIILLTSFFLKRTFAGKSKNQYQLINSN